MAKIKEVNYREILESRHYKLDYTPPQEEVFLRIRGETVGTAGNFVILSGLPKAGKSTYLHAMISSYFSRGQMLYNISMTSSHSRPSIAYFDTESAEYDFYQNLRRIKSLCGIYELPVTFSAFTTRQDNADMNKRLIEEYIKIKTSSVIIVDGMLDLIQNYNDENESRELIDWLKLITAKYSVLIIGVIHTGKKDNHTLGHFGSMADRYAQSVLEVVKDKSNNTLVLSAKYLRSAPEFEPISIMWQGSGYVEVSWQPPSENAPTKSRRR